MATFDAIVIGSGFGGAVAACRLSQAGYRVAILERGKRYDTGHTPFPRDWDNPTHGWMWAHNHGLFDIKPLSEMFIVQSAAYGGGSQIYANVHARMPKDGFDSAWPAGYNRAALDPYYDLVATMLDIKPLPEPLRATLPRAQQIEQMAEKLGRKEQLRYLNLAINFVEQTNRFGIRQKACQMCGECDIGCTYQAKNTLDLNYLADASRRGAVVMAEHEVTHIVPENDGYTVRYVDHANGGQDGILAAQWVFVCAGAVNTTELLLRNRDVHKTLPHLSLTLGQRYSGNGDFLAFAMNTSGEVTPQRGPTITTGTVFDRGIGVDRRWFIFEDGGYPGQVSAMLQAVFNTDHALVSESRHLRDDIIDHLRRVTGGSETDAKKVLTDAAKRSAVFLAMGRDRANGRISLLPGVNALHVEWDVASNMPLYSAEQRFSDDVAKALGGQLALTPFWKLFHQPVSVHNLGGCAMAASTHQGVVDPNGEVHGYPGLFVLDGAALPTSTGVNPSHTIAAVAERNIEHFICRRQPQWQANERPDVRPYIEPLDSIIIPAGGTAEPQTPAIAVEFTETMRGYLAEGAGNYETSYQEGQRSHRAMQFTLTITLPDIDRFLADKDHAGYSQGTLVIAGLTPPGGVTIQHGQFNLFVAGDSPNQRKMLYALPFTGIDDKRYLLDGYKDVRDDGSMDVWKATTTLYTVVRAGMSHDSPVVATGILVIAKLDFMHQLTTFKVHGAPNKFVEVDALLRFGKMFMGSLWDVFIKKPHAA